MKRRGTARHPLRFLVPTPIGGKRRTLRAPSYWYSVLISDIVMLSAATGIDR